MVRIAFAGVFGAVVLFMWGFAFWAAGLGDMLGGVSEAPDEGALVAAVDGALVESGVYFFPTPPKDTGDKAAVEAWATTHKAGPLGMVFFKAGGADAQDPLLMARGFGINFLAALCVAVVARMLGVRGAGFAARYGAVLLFALAAGLHTHGLLWNWFFLSSEYTRMMLVDLVGAWALAGLAIAAITGGGGAVCCEDHGEHA